jgi:hypothetical protein
MTNGANSPPQEQIEAAQKKLRQAKVQLLKAKATLDDDDYFETLSPEDKRLALLQSMQMGPEILKIENAQIALIVAQVEASASALEAATNELKEALSELENITRILKAIGTVLGLVSKILVPVPV